MKTSMAKMEIGLLNSEALHYDRLFYRVKLTNLGIAQEIISRLDPVLETVRNR
jgi:hypothetical protein